jgi:endonuclease-3
MERIEEAVEPFPKAALFELAEDGYDSPFEQLVACMISIRTRDEVTIEVARELLERARTPRQMADLSPAEIEELIHSSSFHERKAGQIHDIARAVLDEHDGRVPCDRDVLTGFSGVGPKCANLVLSIACGEPHISVDVHVHRVTNRWGYVETLRPEQTMRALQEKLPERYWVDINRLLVPFGKHICTGRRPHCSECPVERMCEQMGVEKPR